MAGFVRDLLTEGIPVVDLLEILHSTGKVGEVLSLDQSSVSRIYRQVNDALDLNIIKYDGMYKPTQNLELLNKLRDSCQALRLCNKDSPVRVFVKPLSLSISDGSFDLISLTDHSFGLNRGLKLLNEKAIDIFIADGFEILPEGWSSMQQSTFPAQDFIGTKLYQTSIQPATHPDHPLQKFEQLNGREFWSYPSVAVSNNLFPRLSKELAAKGLWQDQYDIKKYTTKNWEGKSKDRKHIVYINEFALKLIDESISLKMLNYDLGIKSCEVALIHRDNSKNEYLSDYIFQLKGEYARYKYI